MKETEKIKFGRYMCTVVHTHTNMYTKNCLSYFTPFYSSVFRCFMLHQFADSIFDDAKCG